ncbi:uncharacterized protein E0L32_000147 [Thyridium curvatum]|uniref:Glucose-methanol-choline oxidoreductase N-terminal domain-containing protein n=1 Tax=Thyridium curvatum TaxID=1093900 RepID=A0A507B7Z4_9PEZI|nr:uncharacterized protein E0L32_000147 [Thyridium curvatum]TPX15813.1 hypothetical protein E0L32_000147 [Thyridium curvatum]
MYSLRRIAAALVAGTLCVQECAAQAPTAYTDSKTNITFTTWSFTDSGGMTYGMALPEDALTKDATEYIGILRCPNTSGGWCGLSHGASGQMTQALLLMAWPYKDQVLTSFRFATGYTMPGLYTGDAKLTQISSSVNDKEFEIIYRCQGCFAWNQGGSTGSVKTTDKNLIIGRAASKKAPVNPGCPSKITYSFHDNGFGQFGADISGAVNKDYSKWSALATKTVAGECGDTTTAPPTSTPTAPTTTAPAPVASCTAVPTGTYDYIIVGGGAGGIPMADRLSEAGHSVLLLEKGPPSTGVWGGVMKPDWLNGTNLTRFDVPGLCNQIWHDSTGVACLDTDQMAGCVLGGGVAVNAGLWWKPYHLDWDENFPEGWKSKDVVAATDRVFKKIPGTTVPSQDGKRYLQQGFEVLSRGLNASGWEYVVPNDHPNSKNRSFGHSTFMFSHGERGGPLATYLVNAAQRKQFSLHMNTPAKRVVRDGAHVTGVELDCASADGKPTIVSLTKDTGRVILSAGAFGTPRLLMRSGIGPKDQLEIVKNSTDGPTMIDSKQWINLPVGYNLDDHANTDTQISHPDVVFYDFYEAWDAPNTTDKEMYLDKRSGILAQAAPNIGPLFWEEITTSDGKVRQLQWTARVEGDTNNSMIMSQYLGRGATSRGRMTLDPQLNTVVSIAPYLQNAEDREAVIKGIESLQASLKNVKNLTWITPPSNMTVAAYVDSLPKLASARRANHWIGTAKMGTDDGRKADGTAVVDTNAKVYGTDNLFVVDASIFPGHITGNPSAMITIASEQAADKILALKK